MSKEKKEDKNHEAVHAFGGLMILSMLTFWFLAIWIDEYRDKLITSGLFCLAIVLLLLWAEIRNG